MVGLIVIAFFNFVSICMWVMSWWLSSSECMQISLIQYTCKRLPWWADGPLYRFFMWVGRLITVPSDDGLENHRLKRWIITPHAPHHGRPPRAGEPCLLQYCWESPSLQRSRAEHELPAQERNGEKWERKLKFQHQITPLERSDWNKTRVEYLAILQYALIHKNNIIDNNMNMNIST